MRPRRAFTQPLGTSSGAQAAASSGTADSAATRNVRQRTGDRATLVMSTDMTRPVEQVRRGGHLSLPTVILHPEASWPQSNYVHSLKEYLKHREEHVARSTGRMDQLG